MVKGHTSTVEKRGKELERDKEKERKIKQEQHVKQKGKGKCGRNPIISKAVAFLHTGHSYN